MIAVSAVALVMGWLNANESFIWISIATTAAAAILLVVAFTRSKKEPPAAAVAPIGTPGGASGLDPEIEAARLERANEKYSRATTRGSMEEQAADDPGTQVAPAAGDGTETAGGTVVAVPKSKKFHRATCRFASAKATENMDRAEAVERGFNPCGVCKP